MGANFLSLAATKVQVVTVRVEVLQTADISETSSRTKTVGFPESASTSPRGSDVCESI